MGGYLFIIRGRLALWLYVYASLYAYNLAQRVENLLYYVMHFSYFFELKNNSDYGIIIV